LVFREFLTKTDMIKTTNLSKIYRTEDVETTALKQVDLEIEEGEFAAIMGPSGCGKSTLLNIIGMLDSANEGNYFFDGKDVTRLSERGRTAIRKNNIGFVFQSFNLIDELSVFENIELPLVYLNRSKQERKKTVQDIMERMGIAHRAKHFPQQLSGGQQQRVAVGRAVVTHPKLLLADEPTGNLDSSNGNEVMELLTQLNDAGTTIIMVTHSQHDSSYARRVIQLHDGAVVSEVSKTREII
jgi:putative ABC transport system ATP-binding protein